MVGGVVYGAMMLPMELPSTELIMAQASALKNGAMPFMPTRHIVMEGSSFLETVRSRAVEMGCSVAEHLFLYRHAIYESFVLAYWLPDPPAGLLAMVELHVFDESPDHCPPEDLEEVLLTLRPRMEVYREILEALDEAERAPVREREQQREMRKEFAKKQRICGHDDGAKLTEAGAVAMHFQDSDFRGGSKGG